MLATRCPPGSKPPRLNARLTQITAQQRFAKSKLTCVARRSLEPRPGVATEIDYQGQMTLPYSDAHPVKPLLAGGTLAPVPPFPRCCYDALGGRNGCLGIIMLRARNVRVSPPQNRRNQGSDLSLSEGVHP